MKAIFQDAYGAAGGVLKLRDTDSPAVGDGEVLVAVRAASVNHADWATVTGLPYLGRLAFGLPRPKRAIRGRDVAGTVEAVGRNVRRFRPGDAVYGEADAGTFAEYVSVPEEVLQAIPAGLTFEQAAAVPLAATTALQGLRDVGRIQPGQRVLINGASGGVGTFAVQIAKSLGAEVTGVCRTWNMELVRSIGADHVIDYTREDFTRGDRRYDLILDLAGNHPPSAFRRVLTPTGTLVLSSANGGRLLGPMGRIVKTLVLSLFVRQRLCSFVAKRSQQSLTDLAELIGSGTVTPAIDRTYPLGEVPEAMRYFGEEHARAKIVITV